MGGTGRGAGRGKPLLFYYFIIYIYNTYLIYNHILYNNSVTCPLMMRSKPGLKRVRLAQQPMGSCAGLPAWPTRALLRSCGKSGQELGSEWDVPAWGTPAAWVHGGRRGLEWARSETRETPLEHLGMRGAVGSGGGGGSLGWVPREPWGA